jgi:hypothetical protein
MTGVLAGLVVDALYELADEDVQRRRWTAAEGPEVGSFTEAVSRLLDDSGLGDALDVGTEVFGEGIDGLLAELADQLLRINGTHEPQSILADPRVVAVRRLAAEAFALMDSAQRHEE